VTKPERFPWLLVIACGLVVLVATGLYVRHLVGVLREGYAEVGRWRENERLDLLRDIDGAQLRFKHAALADADGDGAGEYADLDALVQAVLGRDPPLDLDAWIDGEPIGLGGGIARLPEALRHVRDRRIRGESYRAVVFLPTDAAGAVPPDLAERHWCAYAWPEDADAGKRTFFINEQREILACEGYVGSDAPAPDAAYLPGPPGPPHIAGRAAADATGRDGRHWALVSREGPNER